ncbi:phosphopantetheine-binding protein, partial [Microbulbifer sp. TYP-18]|uniref:AMP-binding enzyme n=1 Tax=Microbulbifer sp. TYP-18 TaxID=3230024 RepID=UPI0034C6CE3D
MQNSADSGDEPGDARLVAYVVMRGGDTEAASAEKSAEEVSALREHLAERLPSYMLPSFIVPLEQLPLTDNGKVDRRKLPLFEQGTWQSGSATPEGPTESLLASLWQALLQVPPVGREDNFFELGGHSLLATQLV